MVVEMIFFNLFPNMFWASIEGCKMADESGECSQEFLDILTDARSFIYHDNKIIS